MNHLIIFVLDDTSLLEDLLTAWEKAGVTGVTLLESTGMHRVQMRASRDDLPLMPSLRALLSSREEHHRTLFTVVEKEETIDAVIRATEQVVGDLSGHGTGILFVLPVSRAVGLHKAHHQPHA
jgi:nitrogen regulatory protein PII